MPRRLLFLLVPALIIFWNLGYAPFWNPDEGRYTAASYEMAFGLGNDTPDWLVPHLNTVARLNKPPLVYWTTGAAFRVFGPSEWSGRLPSALAALVVMLVLYAWGARVWSARAGLGAALVWATGAIPAAMARTCNTDMLLAASLTLGAYGLFWLLEGDRKGEAGGAEKSRTRGWETALLGVSLGCALLSKGPVGVALPLAVLFCYLVATKRWTIVPWKPYLLALGLALLIGMPWFLAVNAQRPGFLHHFIFEENLGRFSGTNEFHKKSSHFFYLPILIVGLFPWTPFLLPTFASWRENSDLARRSRLFLVIWAAFIVLFFSASSTKLVSYILPAFPALALLMGSTLARWESVSSRLRDATLAFAVGVNAILFTLLLFFPSRAKGSQTWSWEGPLLDGKTVKVADGWPWTLMLCALLMAGIIVWLWVSRRPNGKTLLAGQGAYAAVTVAALIGLAGCVARYEDGSSAVKALVPVLKPDDKVVGYRSFLPTTMFYARRPAYFFEFKNTSGLDEAELHNSPYFTPMSNARAANSAYFRNWLVQQKKRVFILTQGFIDDPLLQHVFAWGRTNDFVLYSNRPKPADFTLDEVAPFKIKHPKVPGKGSKLPD